MHGRLVKLFLVFWGAITLTATYIWQSGGVYERINGDIASYKDAQIASKDRDYPDDRCGGMRFGKLRPCHLQPDLIPTVALVGDSFIEMWYGRVAKLANQHQVGATFFTLGGCPAIAGVYRVGYSSDCAAAHKKQVDSIINNKNYKTIIISSMWVSYLLKNNGDTRIDLNGKDVKLASDDGFRAATLSIKSEIEMYRDLGMRVVIFTTAPYPKKDIPDALRKIIYAGGALPSSQFDFEVTQNTAYPIDNFIKSLKSNGIDIIDLKEEFCGSDFCNAIKNGKSIYSDGSHLRGSYLRGLNYTPIDKYFSEK